MKIYILYKSYACADENERYQYIYSIFDSLEKAQEVLNELNRENKSSVVIYYIKEEFVVITKNA